MHRPREPPFGAPERAAHGRREASGRPPGLQTPQVISFEEEEKDNSVNFEEFSERRRRRRRLGTTGSWKAAREEGEGEGGAITHERSIVANSPPPPV